MSQIPCTALLLRLGGLFRDVGSWWHKATPTDFGLLALAIVVTVWFVTKYYAD